MSTRFNTILLDADIWLHRACVAASSKAQFDDELYWRLDLKAAIRWTRDECARLRKRLGASKIVMAVGDRTANFRKELYPAYKSARRVMPKPPGFRELEEHLRKHATVAQEPRLEGDDILGLLVTREPVAGKVVVSVDKDLRQLPGWHYNPDTDQLDQVDEDAGDLFHLLQTLTGDRVDGYPGCPGVGVVTASRILAGDVGTRWARVVAAFEKAGLTEADAVTQARLARVLRQGDYDRKTKEIKLWAPSY